MTTPVMKALYLNDQFCGFVGSLSLSHDTRFGSTSSSTGVLVSFDFGGGSWISSPPYASILCSPREVIFSIRKRDCFSFSRFSELSGI